MFQQSPLYALLLLSLLGLMACDRTEPEPEQAAEETAAAENTAAPTSADGKYQVGDRLEPQKPMETGELRTLEWDELIPKDYDPMVLMETLDLNNMEDGDPRAQEALNELKAAWSDAPAVEELDGQRVRLPGFVVPLEADATHVHEMLLVPYFGACIHVPPPPSNQVVHVFPEEPVDQKTIYDAVWIEGVINVEKSRTASGEASYTFKATGVEAYE